MQRSRWDLRPLTEEQLDYAALDTAHLPDLYRRLDGELREKGLEKEAKRLFVGMTAVVWQPKTLDRLGAPEAPGIRDTDRRAEGAPPAALPLALRKGAGDQPRPLHAPPRSAARRPRTSGAALPRRHDRRRPPLPREGAPLRSGAPRRPRKRGGRNRFESRRYHLHRPAFHRRRFCGSFFLNKTLAGCP